MPKSGKIYIIPTRFGLVFFVGIVIMLLAGAMYANNMVNLLAFFLLAIALVAMIQTHNNLKNIRLQLVSAEPGFANATIRLTTALENTGQDTRFHLAVQPWKMDLDRESEMQAPLNARAVLRLIANYKVPRRGRYPIGKLRVSTVYPLGLFYAWSWFTTDYTYIVYPEPKGRLPLPRTSLEPRESSRAAARGGDDFHGHKRYSEGDSARRIDWKAYARGRSLLVKEFDEGDPRALLFDWSELRGLGTEERLSQLAAWIERARTQRMAYGLRLPHVFIPPGDDLKHHTRCLEELALYKDSPNESSAE